jgi:hypothetical protein
MDPLAPQTESQPASKGFFYKLIGKLFSGWAARSQQAATLCLTYANSHGYTYTPMNEQPMIDASGSRSAVMAAGYGSMVYRISGVVADRKIDTCLWSVEVLGNHNTKWRYYYLVGRIDLDKANPSLILKPLKAGIGFEDSSIFTQFRNASKEQLEGNFNSYFDVYTVSDDPVNAFELLPPNIMAKLIDGYTNTCLEFVGNSLYMFLPVEPTTNNKPISIVKQPLFDGTALDELIRRLVEFANLYGSVNHVITTLSPEEVISNKPGVVIKL